MGEAGLSPVILCCSLDGGGGWRKALAQVRLCGRVVSVGQYNVML